MECGFVAISDDDFSRVTIAQQFSLRPVLDPSGTSWLPFPFWVYGGAMTAFGTELATARCLALLLGVCATVGIWALARWAGLSAAAVALATVLGAGIPHAAHYGAAMVPDYPSAVLTLVACVTLTAAGGPMRLIGALCALAATLSRYETWPVAWAVSIAALIDCFRANPPSQRPRWLPWSRQARWLLATALLAPSGALAWMVHGFAQHGDALFFLKRVAAYRRALHEPTLPFAERLLKEPLLLVRGEPELVCLVLCLLLAVLAVHGKSGLSGTRWLRPALALLGLMAFLTLGDILDGAPTHHEDRVLLPVWLALALVAGGLLDRLLPGPVPSPLGAARPASRQRARLALLGAALSVAAVASWLRPRVVKTEPFVDRSAEVAIGRVAKRVAASGERLAVFTRDYGYFAVQAAFARPFDVVPLSRHDPRQQELDPFSSPIALMQRLDAMGARYLIVPAENLPKAAGLQQVSTERGFVLLER